MVSKNNQTSQKSNQNYQEHTITKSNQNYQK